MADEEVPKIHKKDATDDESIYWNRFISCDIPETNIQYTNNKLSSIYTSGVNVYNYPNIGTMEYDPNADKDNIEAAFVENYSDEAKRNKRNFNNLDDEFKAKALYINKISTGDLITDKDLKPENNSEHQLINYEAGLSYIKRILKNELAERFKHPLYKDNKYFYVNLVTDNINKFENAINVKNFDFKNDIVNDILNNYSSNTHLNEKSFIGKIITSAQINNMNNYMNHIINLEHLNAERISEDYNLTGLNDKSTSITVNPGTVIDSANNPLKPLINNLSALLCDCICYSDCSNFTICNCYGNCGCYY